jgi:translation elongation factor EF-Tu-like GTPase
VALFRRRTQWPEQMFMIVESVFFIAMGGKGTAVVGQLEGEGLLRVGDVLVHSADEFRIQGIEMFRKMLREASAGMNVALILGSTVSPEGFEGQMVHFRRG